jgi:hypothetical protein
MVNNVEINVRGGRIFHRVCFFTAHLKIVGHLHSFDPRSQNLLMEFWRGVFLKPIRRTPGIIGSVFHQSVPNGVLIYVLQTGDVRSFVRQPIVPILEPDPPALRAILLINLLSRN